MTTTSEILDAAAELGIKCIQLEPSVAREHVVQSLDTFRPFRTSGHVGIGRSSDVYSAELAEFDYSKALPPGPVRVIFDQSLPERHEVVEVADGPQLCTLMYNCSTAEYFASNPAREYLIAVNWYAVEVAGIARFWLRARYPKGTRSL